MNLEQEIAEAELAVSDAVEDEVAAAAKTKRAQKKLRDLRSQQSQRGPFGLPDQTELAGLHLRKMGSGDWWAKFDRTSGTVEIEQNLTKLRDALCAATGTRAVHEASCHVLVPDPKNQEQKRFCEWMFVQATQVPEDCRSLLLETMPHLVRVMRKGQAGHGSGDWKTRTSRHHSNHGNDHALRAYQAGTKDDATGELDRAHQAVRVLMALAVECSSHPDCAGTGAE